MKANKHNLKIARRILKQSFKDGDLSVPNLKENIKKFLSKNPRSSAQVLSALKKITRLEIAKNNTVIESAQKLNENTKIEISKSLVSKYGKNLNIKFKENTNLISGLRIQKGDHLWDGSIKAKLDQLAQKL